MKKKKPDKVLIIMFVILFILLTLFTIGIITGDDKEMPEEITEIINQLPKTIIDAVEGE